MEINISTSIRHMTADQLAEARKQKLPLHCQTMKKFQHGYWSFSDIEELSEEVLKKSVEELLKKGWVQTGCYFVRTAK